LFYYVTIRKRLILRGKLLVSIVYVYIEAVLDGPVRRRWINADDDRQSQPRRIAPVDTDDGMV
jgi:hypothetical protein